MTDLAITSSGVEQRSFLSRHGLARLLIATMLMLPFVTIPGTAARSADTGTASDTPSPPRFKAASGAIDLKMHHRLRVLVPYDQTLFFVDRDKQYGTMAALGRMLQAWIDRTHQAHAKHVVVDLVPVARDRLLPALVAGEGDIAAGDLAANDARLIDVDFTEPWIADLADVVVTGPAAPRLHTVEDLAGAEIYVRRSSSYAGQLALLNETLTAKGLDSITVEPADESLEDEDLLEMVNAGLLPMTIVDERKAKLWAEILPNLQVRPDLKIGTDRTLAWAVRKDSPELRATVSAFLKSHGDKTGFGPMIRRNYFQHLPFATNAYAPDAVSRFDQTLDLFRRTGDQYGIDGLLLAALGYQESQLDQSRRGAGGAAGIMQVMPATAANPDIAIDDIDRDPERNVEAGAKYLRHVIDSDLDDPAIDTKNRMLMAIAAYRAGPGQLAAFRRAAAQSGLDPNLWFDNVENGAARIAGRGIVLYVKTVYEYYVAYGLLLDKEKRP